MERLGPLQDAVDATVADLVERKIVERAWAGDHTAWQDDPTEVADRLGGLHVGPEGVGDRGGPAPRPAAGAADARSRVVVRGMGGPSLFPEVLARPFPPASGRPELRVLDT